MAKIENLKMSGNAKDEPLKMVKMLISSLQNVEQIFQLLTTPKGDFPFF